MNPYTQFLSVRLVLSCAFRIAPRVVCVPLHPGLLLDQADTAPRKNHADQPQLPHRRDASRKCSGRISRPSQDSFGLTMEAMGEGRKAPTLDKEFSAPSHAAKRDSLDALERGEPCHNSAYFTDPSGAAA